MSVIETLIGDQHAECRVRLEHAENMVACAVEAACVDTFDELLDFITRRRLSDKKIGELLNQVDRAERELAKPWYVADPQTLEAMHYQVGAVLLDANSDAWQLLDDPDEGPIWRVAGSAQWWTTNDPVKFGPAVPVQILHQPKETKK